MHIRRPPSGDGPRIYRPNESVAVRLEPSPRPVAHEPDSIPPPPRDSLLARVNRRRGQITGMDETPAGKAITADVPLSEMFGYATTVRSMSQGRATFTMEFAKYMEVPPNIADGIIKK